LSHSPYLPVTFMVAAILAASALAGSGIPVSARAGPPVGSSAGEADVPDEPGNLVAAGDFNRDGIADIVATLPDSEDSGQHLLTVRLGQPDGTFRSVDSHTVIGKDPRALVVGDFNGDGNPDVIVGDEDGVIREFLGDGRGNLVDAGKIATLGSVASIASGHFTHDGSLDLVVSDFQSNSAAILLGSGDGSFRLVWSFQLPRRGTEFRVATADFNKDGISDLVITSEDDYNYEVMLGNGNGTFTYAPELSHLKDPNSYCPS
jgi:FG-GAP-like repeat